MTDIFMELIRNIHGLSMYVQLPDVNYIIRHLTIEIHSCGK